MTPDWLAAGCWHFDDPVGPTTEFRCQGCRAWVQVPEWLFREVDCDECGAGHPTLECPACGHFHDAISAGPFETRTPAF